MSSSSELPAEPESVDQITAMVTETLQNQGVLGKIKAQLKLHVLQAMEQHGGVQDTLAVKSTALLDYVNTAEGDTCMQLVLQFLDAFGLTYTASMLKAEAHYVPPNGNDREESESRTQPLRGMAERLGVHLDQKSSTNEQFATPILNTLVDVGLRGQFGAASVPAAKHNGGFATVPPSGGGVESAGQDEYGYDFDEFGETDGGSGSGSGGGNGNGGAVDVNGGGDGAAAGEVNAGGDVGVVNGQLSEPVASPTDPVPLVPQPSVPTTDVSVDDAVAGGGAVLTQEQYADLFSFDASIHEDEAMFDDEFDYVESVEHTL